MTDIEERGVPEAEKLAASVQPFSVDVRPDRERVYVVPSGELDIATVGRVVAEIDELAGRRFETIVLICARSPSSTPAACISC